MIPAPGVACPGCGNLVECTCDAEKKHKEDCRYLAAMRLSVELECEHGFQACPECDPCDCGAGGEVPVR